MCLVRERVEGHGSGGVWEVGVCVFGRCVCGWCVCVLKAVCDVPVFVHGLECVCACE